MYLPGKKAKIKAADTRPKAIFSVAWLSHKGTKHYIVC